MNNQPEVEANAKATAPSTSPKKPAAPSGPSPTSAPKPNADFADILGSEEDTNCKYIRVRPLGAGSFAEAWEVRRRSDGQVLAAKIMFLKTMDARAQKRAKSEVQCLQSCQHFACLSFVEYFESENRILIIVEYCNAGDLAGYINACRESNQPFPEPTIAIIILQLLLAVEHMHRRRIIHRDIKSQNVFLSTTGLVKVGDFGLSNEYATISGDVANTFCGTPYYLAPEVWRRQRYGARADVWALGVIAYELITGRCPFTSTDMSGLAKRVETPHHPINAARYKVSQELVDLVDLMLTKDPSHRPRAIHLLMHTPYLRRQLSSFVPTVNNTDRVSPEMKASIAACVADVEQEMALQQQRDVAEAERIRALIDQQQQQHIHAAMAMGGAPGASGNFSAANSAVGHPQQHMQQRSGGHPVHPSQQQQYHQPSSPNNILSPVSYTNSDQQQRAPHSPTTAGAGTNASPSQQPQVPDPFAFEGPVRKLKDGGKFVTRYLVLTTNTLEVLEDARKPRNRRPLALNRLKGADAAETDELGSAIAHIPLPLDDPANASLPAVAPLVQHLPLAAAANGANGGADQEAHQQQLYPHLLVKDCCMLIQTNDGHKYYFTADDREAWIKAIGDALGASDLQ